MRLSLYYPRSFRSLLLSAFALVALPLLAGIATMTFTLDRIAIEGRRSVDITAEVTADYWMRIPATSCGSLYPPPV